MYYDIEYLNLNPNEIFHVSIFVHFCKDLSYKLIESNQDWKSKWFYICNHHLELPKPSGKQPKHRA
jgi:hypothetical protein